MKLEKALGILFIAAILFISILHLEPEIFKRNEQSDAAFSQIRFVDKMRFEAITEFQIQSRLGLFKAKFIKNPNLFLQADKEPLELLNHLPKHQMIICTASSGKLLKMNSFGNSYRALCQVLVKAHDLFLKRYADSDGDDKFSAIQKDLNEKVGNFLGSKNFGSRFIFSKTAKVACFKTLDKSNYFYWDTFTISNTETGYIFVKFDFKNLHKLYPLFSFINLASEESNKFGYFILDSNKYVCNKQMKASLTDEYLEWLANEASKNPYNQRIVSFKGTSAILGITPHWIKARPLLILPKNTRKATRGNTDFKLIFFLCYIAITFFIIETFIFQRGPRIPVSVVLVVSFAITICIPFIIARSIFSNTLHERLSKDKLLLKQNLHNTLVGIDTGINIFHSNINYMIKNCANKPEVVSRIINEDKSGSINAQNETGSVADYIAAASFAPLRKIDNVNDQSKRMNAVVIQGPNNFVRVFNRQLDQTYTHDTVAIDDSSYNMADVVIKEFKKTIARNNLDPDFFSNNTGKSKINVKDLKHEEIRNVMIGAIGLERMFFMLTAIDTVNWFSSSIGVLHFNTFAIKAGNIIRYFGSTVWDEFAVLPAYLRIVFANPYQPNNTSDASIQLQGYSNLTQKLICLASEPSDILTGIIKNSRMKRQIIRKETLGKDSAIYESIPANNFSLYHIGGKIETGFLKLREERTKQKFFIFILSFILLAIFIAYIISYYFTSPLNYLLAGMSRININDFSVRLKATQNDEFGVLANSFNNLAKSLEERETLGEYVSESVLQLAKNPDHFEQAKYGKETSYTVLFADLVGFKTIQNNGSASEIEEVIKSSLNIFFSCANKFEGEVDKVMAEKILITFSHDKLGEKEAAEAAIKLAKSALAKFKDISSVTPVFGINSGDVISGIIGTPSVRMDYTVIGDAVNLAARLCALAKEKEKPIIISSLTKQLISKKYNFERFGSNRIKGKKQEIDAYSLHIS